MSDPEEGPRREVRPSFSVTYLSLFLVTTLIASTISLSVTKFWGKITEEEEDRRVLEITIVPAQNIAAVPENIIKKLEFIVAVSPSEKQVVKSLFGFQAFIRNASKKTSAENVLVYLNPPTDVELIEPATIKTDSKLLEISTQNSQKSVEGGGVTFTLEQLAPGQEVSFSYTGFSRQVELRSQWLRAEARAKGWQTGTFVPGYVDGIYGSANEYGFSPDSRGGKRLADYTAIDAIALFLVLLTLVCALGICAWLLTRFLLPIYVAAWKEWRSR